MKTKINRNIIIWIGVIAFSIILGVSAVLYFQITKIPVLTQDVAPGTQITEDMYKLIEVNPRDDLLEFIVVNPGELFKDGVVGADGGKYTLAAMTRGQPIPKRMITANPMDPQFGIASDVLQGEVAISAGIKIENAVGGMIDKGNIVNLSYVPVLPGRDTEGIGSRQLDIENAKTLENIRIIEVRNENGMPRFSSQVSGGSAVGGSTIIVTFAVPDNEAAPLSVALASGGELSVMLPSRIDTVNTEND